MIGQKAYEPQKPMEKIEQLYAELQDNKVEGFGIGSFLEKNNKNLEDEKLNGMDEDNADFIRQQEILQNEINKNKEDEN